MPSKEYVEKVTIGGVARLDGKVVLHAYDPCWADQFKLEEAKIACALKGKPFRVEHVGSTSVPGLCAKPVIDILLLVEDSANEATYVEALEKEGYTLRIREAEWFGHRMLKGQSPEVNLHVFSFGCEEANRMLAFRDHLRTNEADRRLYAETKERLAKQDWAYVQEYADAKSEVVRQIISHIEDSIQ